MTTAETETTYTAEQITAYEAYISAMAEHNIVCARPGATTREKMDAAFAASRAFDRFCEIAGLSIGRVSLPADKRRIEHLERELGLLTESARSAAAMLAGIDALDAFTTISDGVLRADFCAASTLLNDAGTVLRAAVKRADGE